MALAVMLMARMCEAQHEVAPAEGVHWPTLTSIALTISMTTDLWNEKGLGILDSGGGIQADIPDRRGRDDSEGRAPTSLAYRFAELRQLA